MDVCVCVFVVSRNAFRSLTRLVFNMFYDCGKELLLARKRSLQIKRFKYEIIRSKKLIVKLMIING
jgi:hypothetical protein